MRIPIATCIATLILLVFTLQYPLSTTWPIGGDVTRYISRAIAVQQQPLEVFANSNYPGTVLVVALAGFLPIPWPELFTWLMVISYLSVGLTLGIVTKRLAGWPAAATAIFAWGLASTNTTAHIEDATLAQLISFAPMLLSVSSFLSRRYWLSLAYFFLATALHPASGLVLIPVFALTTLIMLFTKRWHLTPKNSFWPLLSLFIIIITYAFSRHLINGDFTVTTSFANLNNFLETPFAPFLILTPIGFISLGRKRHKHPLKFATIASFSVISTWLAFNSLLGVGLFENRFQSYFIITAIILSSIIIPHLLKQTFPLKLPRHVFIFLVTIAMSIPTWQHNSFVYDFYESPGKYARAHNEEIASFYWMRDNLPAQSHIVTTKTNRHSEWIPILTSHTWTGIESNDDWYTTNATHAAILTHREKPPQALEEENIIFENNAAIIFELSYD